MALPCRSGNARPTIPRWPWPQPPGRVVVTRRSGGMWCHFDWGGRPQVLACQDPRLWAALCPGGGAWPECPAGTLVVVALSPPVDGPLPQGGRGGWSPAASAERLLGLEAGGQLLGHRPAEGDEDVAALVVEARHQPGNLRVDLGRVLGLVVENRARRAVALAPRSCGRRRGLRPRNAWPRRRDQARSSPETL